MLRTRLVATHVAASFLAAALCIATPSSAHGPADSPEGGLRSLVGDSALVAYGRVADIAYRSSQPTEKGAKGVPHTFVTYEVKAVYRGDASIRRLVLRVPGGADGSGGIFMPTTSPIFARGQEDVLFVAGGPLEGCQLVGCVEGRFRVVEGRVYNGWGVPVAEVGERLVIAGKPRYDLNVMELPRPSFEALLERPETKKLLEEKYPGASLEEMKARYEREAPDRQVVSFGSAERDPADGRDVPGAEGRKAGPITSFEGPVRLEEFAAAIRKLSDALGPPKAAVVMADPEAAFRVPAPRAEAVRAEATERPRSAEEMRELESMLEGTDSRSDEKGVPR